MFEQTHINRHATVEAEYARHVDLVLVVMAIGLAQLILERAWVCDDAFITLRTIDNFVNGYGLRWNVHERVQAYTHPLWLAVQIPLYLILRQGWWTTITVSLLCSFSAIALVLRQGRERPVLMLGCFVLPLYFLTPVLDFATSGLETPLSYLCMSAFIVALNSEDYSIPRLRLVSLTAAIGAVNRLDMLLLFTPAIACLAWKLRGKRAMRAIVLSASPLIGWELFSIWYYGFPFPNTYYAKLGTDIPRVAYLEQGMAYALDLLARHPACVLVLTLSCGVGMRSLWHARGVSFRSVSHATLPAVSYAWPGILLYCAYVVWVGGDFMSGRFWATPVYLAAGTLPFIVGWQLPRKLDAYAALGIVAAVFLVTTTSATEKSWKPGDPLYQGIHDERSWYEGGHTLTSQGRRTGPEYGWNSVYARRDRTLAFDRQQSGNSTALVRPLRAAGYRGYYGGASIVFLDVLGLGDPLIARLPASDRIGWTPGHFEREIPEGYVHALETGTTQGMDANLREYYERLLTITSGSLGSIERLRTILLFNAGAYDSFLTQYVTPKVHREIPLAAMQRPVSGSTTWNAPTALQLPPRTKTVFHAGRPLVAAQIEVSIDPFGYYELTFSVGEEALGMMVIRPKADIAVAVQREPETYWDSSGRKLLVTSVYDLPHGVGGVPFDRITVLPRGGHYQLGTDHQYSLGSLRLL